MQQTATPDARQDFPALVVRPGVGDQPAACGVERLGVSELPPGEVLIEVEYSSLNYKDALASRGHRGVVRSLPHVPGIDCAGAVIESSDDRWRPGDAVLVTGYGLGSDAWGGYAGLARVRADWPVPIPPGWTARDAMLVGTAGFTAAQSVDALLRHGAEPGRGPLLVTGATGGVGVWAVALLAKLGFEVVAMSGKAEWRDALKQLGATRVVGRDALAAGDDKPLLSTEFAGGVDTVGGGVLSALIRSTGHRGCVTCCGLVAGVELPLSVYPFILRGVTLCGIDSQKCPRDARLRVWQHLAGPWRVELPGPWVTEVDLETLPEQIERMFAGRAAGRTLVRPISAQPLEPQ